MGFGMMGFFQYLFPLFFFLIFFLTMGVVVASLFRSVRQWKRNNASPVLTVEAQVVSRRTNYHRGSKNHRDTPLITSLSRWKAETGWSFPFPGRNTGC